MVRNKANILTASEIEMVNHLMEAIRTLRTVDECEMFFYDLCSKGELKKISKRIQVAKLIDENETYRNILKKTNASNIVISRVKQVMSNKDSVLATVVKRI